MTITKRDFYEYMKDFLYQWQEYLITNDAWSHYLASFMLAGAKRAYRKVKEQTRENDD